MAVKNAEKTVDEELGLIMKKQQEDASNSATDDTEVTDADLKLLSEAEREVYQQVQADTAEAPGEAEGNAEAKEQEPPAPEAPVEEAPNPLQAELEREQGKRQALQLDSLKGQQADLKAQRKDAYEKMVDGALSEDDYHAKLEEILEKDRELSTDIFKVESEVTAKVDAQVKADNESWTTASDNYMKVNAVLSQAEHFDAFNEVVGDVTENKRYAHLSFDQQLKIAGTLYAAEAAAKGTPITLAQDAPPPKKGDTTADGKDGAAKESQRPVPPTLAQIPSETINPHETASAQILAKIDDPETAPLEREKLIGSLPEHLFDQIASQA